MPAVAREAERRLLVVLSISLNLNQGEKQQSHSDSITSSPKVHVKIIMGRGEGSLAETASLGNSVPGPPEAFCFPKYNLQSLIKMIPCKLFVGRERWLSACY